MLWTTWYPWEYDVHSCGSFFLFYPVVYLELYLYVFLSHSASFSLAPCWSLIVSLPGLSWHQGLFLSRQCCPRSDRPLPYSWCSQSFCSHKGEAKGTWPRLKQPETVPRQTHTCWHPALPTHSSTFSLLSVTENSCFQSYSSKHFDLLTFLLLFFCLKYNLHLLSALISICAYQFWKEDPFMLCCSSSQFVHYKFGDNSQEGFHQGSFLYVKEINQIFL